MSLHYVFCLSSFCFFIMPNVCVQNICLALSEKFILKVIFLQAKKHASIRSCLNWLKLTAGQMDHFISSTAPF